LEPKSGTEILHFCASQPSSSGQRNPQPVDWLFQGPHGLVALEVGGNLLAGDASVLHAAGLAGQGILFEPTFLIGEDLAQGRLVEIVPDQIPRNIPIYAVWSPARRLSSKVRSFVDLLAEHMQPVPPWDRGLPRLKGHDDVPP
jgi:DNA-binding transcriptional LysR family regulator